MKPFLFIAFFMASVSVSAQKGFFIQPQIGVGTDKPVSISTVKWLGYCDCGVEMGENKTVATYDAQMLAGYGFSVFRVSTGLQLLRTSGAQNISTISYSTGVKQRWPVVDKNNQYYQLSIPLNFNWKINVNKHFSVAPGAGLRINKIVQNFTNVKHTLDVIRGTVNAFVDVSLMADLEYFVNENIGVVLTPSYNFFTTRIETMPEKVLGGLRTINRDIILWGGVRWYFHKKAAPLVVIDQS